MSSSLNTNVLAGSNLPADVPHYSLFINGEWQKSASEPPVLDRNPATSEVFAVVEQAGEQEALSAITAAEDAAEAWGATSVIERADLLQRVASIFEARRMEIVDVLIDEAGSLPIKAHFEVNYAINLCNSAAGGGT